jgi:hypothetical protein
MLHVNLLLLVTRKGSVELSQSAILNVGFQFIFINEVFVMMTASKIEDGVTNWFACAKKSWYKITKHVHIWNYLH